MLTYEDIMKIDEVVKTQCQAAIAEFLKGVKPEIAQEETEDGWNYFLVVRKGEEELLRMLILNTDVFDMNMRVHATRIVR